MQRLWISLSLFLSLLTRVGAEQAKKEELVDRVRNSIDLGVQYLRRAESGNGHWEVDGLQSQARHGGWSSLSILALLNAGVKPDDPTIDRGLKWLRDVEPKYTYVVGLQTMVFVAAGKKANDAHRYDPLASKPYLTLAAIDEAQGHPLVAQYQLEKAVRRFPADPQVWLRLADFQANVLNHPAIALTTVRAALFLDPNNKQAQTIYFNAQNKLHPAPATP